uniref:Uncharacterized protein LOC114342876 n=1 Tax=Diabrotica virgifera virgifera TaxID=50390 RepID=A0A6P7GTX6_DIAVI
MNMEIKPKSSERTERTCKIEIGNDTLDGFKIEIKEEPKTETAADQAFDYLNLNKFTVNTKVEQDEHKFTLVEEKQTINEENLAIRLTLPLRGKFTHLRRCLKVGREHFVDGKLVDNIWSTNSWSNAQFIEWKIRRRTFDRMEFSSTNCYLSLG